NQPPLIFIVIISYIVIVWSRALQAKTAPNALRMTELFFISFWSLPQRCKYNAAAEYEKYERAEIKIRR
ncbi:hypothetical protein, partial [Phascolarctobacterium succinatutens]|uniref:hypothetical protein n=1 Tax=Phascolarctobacterium succinatutens TaxID=626940 RepID=UPI003AB642F6